MTTWRPFGDRSSRPGWPDDASDPLVAVLEELGTPTDDMDARVTRRRSNVLTSFVEAGARRAPHAPWFAAPRRLAVALVAATLLVALSLGGIAASSAGQPLYGLRLAVEEIALPYGHEARLLAQLDRLDRRLDEVAAGMASRNGAVVAAAMAAYEDIVEDIEDGRAPEGTARDTALLRIRGQLRRLERLAATDPGVEAGAVLVSARSFLGWLADPSRGGGQPPPRTPMPTADGRPPRSEDPEATPATTSSGRPDAGDSPPAPSNGAGMPGGDGADGGHAGSQDPAPSGAPRSRWP